MSGLKRVKYKLDFDAVFLVQLYRSHDVSFTYMQHPPQASVMHCHVLRN